MEYLQGRVTKAEAMVASAEEAVHTLQEGQLQSLQREEQLHNQVLELELHALAQQHQIRCVRCKEHRLQLKQRQERDDVVGSKVWRTLYWQHKGEMEQVQAATAAEVVAGCRGDRAGGDTRRTGGSRVL